MKKLTFILSALFVFAACGQKHTGESKTDKDAAKEVVVRAKKGKKYPSATKEQAPQEQHDLLFG